MASVNDCVPHARHYCKDGNIALIAGRTIFRLYSEFLIQRSEIMKGMLMGAKSHDFTDGRPKSTPTLVLLDSAEDLSKFFDFLFLTHSPPYPPNFETILSALKIAKKYGFACVSDAAAWHLRAMFPTSLDDFVANPGLTMFTGLKAAQVARAAWEYELPDLLPLALYAIVTYTWNISGLVPAHLVHSLLPPILLGSVIAARVQIHSEALKIAFTMHEHNLLKSSCTTRISPGFTCAKGDPDLIWANPRTSLEEFLRNPMRELVIRRVCEFHTLCHCCVAAMSKKMRADLEAFYDKLPAIFQLDQVTNETT